MTSYHTNRPVADVSRYQAQNIPQGITPKCSDDVTAVNNFIPDKDCNVLTSTRLEPWKVMSFKGLLAETEKCRHRKDMQTFQNLLESHQKCPGKDLEGNVHRDNFPGNGVAKVSRKRSFEHALKGSGTSPKRACYSPRDHNWQKHSSADTNGCDPSFPALPVLYSMLYATLQYVPRLIL
ncbi:hypothetical protein QZH41_006753 [Actinostola sp. cb2023]|nr:hypothetical protein QZH41_006753 [Actinostola sp. cb2023]